MAGETRAQRKAIDHLKKKHGPIFHDGYEADGVTVRVHWAGDEPKDERTRVISPSGIATEPVDLDRLR